MLKHETEKKLIKKYGDILRKYLEELEKKYHNADKILKYEQYFKMLLIENGEERIFEFLSEKHITSCAFYGRTQITYVLLALLKKWNIDIEYVIENFSGDSSWENIPLIRRDDIRLLNCENIIICDINDEAIKQKLINLKYEGCIFSYKELTYQ